MKTAEEFLKNVARVHAIINDIIAGANAALSEENRRSGGYLTIRHAKTGQIVLILACGIIPEEKQARYLHLSQEKGQRLFNNPGHCFSQESRNPANNEFAGALRGYRYIYSFSGHQENIDEAISLAAFYLVESVAKAWPEDPDTKVAFNHVKFHLFDRNPQAKQILHYCLD